MVQDDTLSFMESIQDTYSYHFQNFVDWLGPREFSLGAVRDYFIYLNEHSGYAPGTIRIKRQAVKKRVKQYAYEVLDFEGRAKVNDLLYELDHTGETSAPKLQNDAIGTDKYLTKAEVKELLLKARTRRQMAFIRFLWYSGCRISEMCGIRLYDVKLVGNIYYVSVKGKKNKYRTIKLNEDLYQFVRETFRGETYLFETQNGRPYARTYISNQIKRIGKAVLHRSISAHTLRHSFATWKVKKGVSVDAIADYLGHSSPAITLSMYSHNSMDDIDLLDDDITVAG
jgi:integrase